MALSVDIRVSAKTAAVPPNGWSCVGVELFWGRLSGGLISEKKSDVQTNEVDIPTQLVAPAESAKIESGKRTFDSQMGQDRDPSVSMSAMTAGVFFVGQLFIVIPAAVMWNL